MYMDFELNFAVYANQEFVAAFYLLADAEGFCESYGVSKAEVYIRNINTGGLVACWQNGRWEWYE